MNNKYLFLTILTILLIFLQIFPYVYLSSQTPKDRIYLGAERYYPDHYTLLFHISQGGKGFLASPFLFTNELHGPTLAHFEYKVLGIIGSLFNLAPPIIFILSRAIFLLMYIFLSYFFIGLFIKNNLHKNLILILSFLYDGFFFLNQNNFYQPLNFITRLAFEPHKLIGMSLTILILYSIIKKKAIPLILFSILIGFIHGTSAVNLIAAILLFEFLLIISSKPDRFPILSLLFLPFAPIYWKLVFSQNPIWNYILVVWETYFVQVDKSAPFLPILTAYLLILGPLLILAALGLKKFYQENKKNGLLLVSFLVSNFMLFFFGYIILNTSRIRFFQTPYLLFLCIIAYYGMIKIVKKNLSILILIAFLIIPGLPNIISSIEKYLAPYKNSPDIAVYLPLNWYQAILWLKNTPPDSVILSLPKAGLVIPPAAGRRVLVADFVSSYKYYEKLPYVEKFFKSQMTLAEAKNYLKSEAVNYILYGLEEKTYGNLDKYSSILKPVFENEDATIYHVSF